MRDEFKMKNNKADTGQKRDRGDVEKKIYIYIFLVKNALKPKDS